MIVLSASDLTKTYGTDVIIKGADFHINGGDRVGLVGRNGAGKTTLLNMLTGELRPDGGRIYMPAGLRMGYLRQRDNFGGDMTVMEAVESIFEPMRRLEEQIASAADMVAQTPEDRALLLRLDSLQQEYEMRGGYTYKSEMTGILSSMAFGPEYYDKKIGTLSGGERTRLALAALLLEKPDLLILDEPTNHLDIGMLKWLEQYLSSYRGSMIIVSHDRYFLNRTVNRIFEIEHHRLRTYDGNYDEYLEKKRQQSEAEMRAYENQQREISRQEAMIRAMKERGTEHLAKRARSREKRLDMIERIEKPKSAEDSMKIRFEQDFQSGSDVIMAEDLSKSFGEGKNRRKLFDHVSLDIKRGEKICIVGQNGIGKTTLLKIIMNELRPDSGRIRTGHNVTFGYYDQGQMLLDPSNTVLEEMKNTYRLYTDTKMRSILGRFLFKGDDVFLKVRDLSGGEKARLSLLKMMLGGANTLILDEPTNHMDIESKEVFEEALAEFPGTAVIVSHDRYFLQKIPDRILELTPDGMVEYLGKYDYYMEKKDRIESGKKYLESMASSEKQEGAGENDREKALSPEEQRRLNKEREAEERRRTRRREALEEELAGIEEEIAGLSERISRPENAADYKLLSELSEQLTEAKARSEELMEEWLALD
ncbi:MAG: ABC-F family ATP-binding cassette domain-containing protein [Anaerovoracaceae bacterium]|nr:ABC-F family ATP-binding cassette domain-containing protein [Anaerovoracaceae bacterium]